MLRYASKQRLSTATSDRHRSVENWEVFGHSTLSAELVEHTIGIKKNGRFSRRCGEAFRIMRGHAYHKMDSKQDLL